jgi:hypothetical protein
LRKTLTAPGLRTPPSGLVQPPHDPSEAEGKETPHGRAGDPIAIPSYPTRDQILNSSGALAHAFCRSRQIAADPLGGLNVRSGASLAADRLSCLAHRSCLIIPLPQRFSVKAWVVAHLAFLCAVPLSRRFAVGTLAQCNGTPAVRDRHLDATLYLPPKVSDLLKNTKLQPQ